MEKRQFLAKPSTILCWSVRRSQVNLGRSIELSWRGCLYLKLWKVEAYLGPDVGLGRVVISIG